MNDVKFQVYKKVIHSFQRLCCINSYCNILALFLVSDSMSSGVYTHTYVGYMYIYLLGILLWENSNTHTRVCLSPQVDFQHKFTVQASPTMDKRKSLINSRSSPPASPTIIPRLRAIQCETLSQISWGQNTPGAPLLRSVHSPAFAHLLFCIHPALRVVFRKRIGWLRAYVSWKWSRSGHHFWF